MRNKILEAVYAAIDEVNAEFADGARVRLDKSEETHLLGGESGVDSLTFVNFIVAVEGQLERSHGTYVVLVDEDSLALMEHPFRTVGALADYIEKVINRQQQAKS